MLSNKLLLAAARGRSVQSWLGNVECQLVKWDDPSLMFLYGSQASPWLTGGFGTLHPLLETVKADTQIAEVFISVDAATIFMTECYLYFDNVPSLQYGIKFEKLSKIIIHSTTGGEPFTISDVQSCWDNINMCYDLFSEDLANWGYTNLTAETYLDFPLELEWYE